MPRPSHPRPIPAEPGSQPAPVPDRPLDEPGERPTVAIRAPGHHPFVFKKMVAGPVGGGARPHDGDIVRVVSDYVTLKKRGANYLACCPFHSEKTPSFTVHAGKGLFKCFGCGAGGSIFDFVMRIEGCGFPEAVRIVAQKSGIPIPAVEETEDHKKIARERESVLRLNEWAAEFFEHQLDDGVEGSGARERARALRH